MKPLAFVLLVLVGSMILTSVPSQIYADTQLDSLLRIANQARDNIKIRLSQLATIPDEIATLYKQGSAETDALAQSVAQEDITSSKQHFLSAMRLFKVTSDKISSSAPAIVGEPLPPTDTSRLKNAIATIGKTAERIKAVATKNNVSIDFTEFDNLMRIAKQNLEEGKTDEVYKTLEIANQFLLDAYNSLSAAAKQNTSDRAKAFAAKQIERLDKLIAQAKELNVSQDIIDTLEAAKTKLQATSDSVEIKIEIKDINIIKEMLNESKAKRINVIINQLETKLENLGKDVQDDAARAKIAQAKDMLPNLKQLVSDGKFDEALQMIKSIEEFLNSITMRSNTVTNETPNAPQTSNDTTNSARDSKLERIKTKIQTLEEQLNSLSDKASGNDVASQWIKRAFSLIEKAKGELEKSPEKVMRTLNEVDKIVRMIQKVIQ